VREVGDGQHHQHRHHEPRQDAREESWPIETLATMP
jgi:hypothetical protein